MATISLSEGDKTMKLRDLERRIKQLAQSVPDVHTVLDTNDIYDLNNYPNIDFCAFVMTEQSHRQEADMFYANYYLFMVDREMSNDDNKNDIKSHSIDLLRDMLLQLENDGYQIENVSYTTFNERFQQSCSGAYANVTIVFPVNDCVDQQYPEIN